MKKRREEKKWITPQLIVMIRGKPEENTLASCKASSGGVMGAHHGNDGCYAVMHCINCNSRVAS